MEWTIVLAVAVVVCIIGVLMVVAMPKFNMMQKLVDKVNLISREILTGLSVIRAFSREKKEEERFEEANGNLTRSNAFYKQSHVIYDAGTYVCNERRFSSYYLGCGKED